MAVDKCVSIEATDMSLSLPTLSRHLKQFQLLALQRGEQGKDDSRGVHGVRNFRQNIRQNNSAEEIASNAGRARPFQVLEQVVRADRAAIDESTASSQSWPTCFGYVQVPRSCLACMRLTRPRFHLGWITRPRLSPPCIWSYWTNSTWGCSSKNDHCSHV